MKTFTYPAVLHPEAMENIKDAFGLYYEDAMEGQSALPEPASPGSVKLEAGEFVLEMSFSPAAYLAKRPAEQV